MIAFGIPWLLLGMRILESNLPSAVRLRRSAVREMERDGL
jgi:hypothetical protein